MHNDIILKKQNGSIALIDIVEVLLLLLLLFCIILIDGPSMSVKDAAVMCLDHCRKIVKLH